MEDEIGREEDGQGDCLSDAGSGQGQSFQTFVAEAAHVKELVAALDQDEGIVSQVCTILDRYQEQPQLLDSHIECIVNPLAATLLYGSGIDGGSGKPPAEEKEIRRSCRVLYVLSKNRTFKVHSL